MGWKNPLKSLAKGAKKLVTDPKKWAENAGRSVGKAAKTAAPVLPFLTPLGPLGAAAVGALGSVAGGGNSRDHLKAGAAGYAGGKAQGLLGKLKAGQGAVSGAMGGGGGGVDSVEGMDAAAGGGGGWDDRFRDLMGGASQFLGGKDGFGLDDVLKIGAGAEGVYNGVQEYGLRNKAIKSAEDAYNQRAPLRQQGLSMLTPGAMERPDFGSTFADPGGAYSAPVQSGPAPMPGPPGPGAGERFKPLPSGGPSKWLAPGGVPKQGAR